MFEGVVTVEFQTFVLTAGGIQPEPKSDTCVSFQLVAIEVVSCTNPDSALHITLVLV